MYKFNRIKLILSTHLLIGFSSIAQNPLEQLIQEKIDAMSLSEKIKQLHGQDMWSTEDNTELNIPGFTVSDAITVTIDKPRSQTPLVAVPEIVHP